MIDQWEEFKGGPTGKPGERMHVSLNSKGLILLNRKAFEALGEPRAVILSFERRNSKIGIRSASPALSNAFPVKPRPEAHSRIVHASPFCRNYGIRVSGTVAFAGVSIDSDGMLVLDLDKTMRVGRVARPV